MSDKNSLFARPQVDLEEKVTGDLQKLEAMTENFRKDLSRRADGDENFPKQEAQSYLDANADNFQESIHRLQHGLAKGNIPSA